MFILENLNNKYIKKWLNLRVIPYIFTIMSIDENRTCSKKFLKTNHEKENIKRFIYYFLIREFDSKDIRNYN